MTCVDAADDGDVGQLRERVLRSRRHVAVLQWNIATLHRYVSTWQLNAVTSRGIVLSHALTALATSLSYQTNDGGDGVESSLIVRLEAGRCRSFAVNFRFTVQSRELRCTDTRVSIQRVFASTTVFAHHTVAVVHLLARRTYVGGRACANVVVPLSMYCDLVFSIPYRGAGAVAHDSTLVARTGNTRAPRSLTSTFLLLPPSPSLARCQSQRKCQRQSCDLC